MNKLFAGAALAAATHALETRLTVEVLEGYGDIDPNYCCTLYSDSGFNGEDVQVCADRRATGPGAGQYFEQSARSLASLTIGDRLDNTIESFKCGNNITAEFCAGIFETVSNPVDPTKPYKCHGNEVVYVTPSQGDEVASNWSARNIVSSVILYAADDVLTNFNDCRARVYAEPGCAEGNAYASAADGHIFMQIGADSDTSFEQQVASGWFGHEIQSIQLPGKSEFEFYPKIRHEGIGQVLKNTFDQKPLDEEPTQNSCMCFEVAKNFGGLVPVNFDLQSFKFKQDPRLVQ